MATRGQTRKQGPQGISLSLADPFGIGKLAVNANEEELERAIAFEGYQRGLDEFKVFMALSNRRRSRSAEAQRTGGLRLGIELAPLDAFDTLQTLVQQERQRYESFIGKEFDALPEFVRNMFADPYGPNTKLPRSAFGGAQWQANNRAYYLEMRSRYYVAGYDDPARTIFSQIRPATLLGKDVGCGLHKKFAEKLEALEQVDFWTPALTARVKAEIKEVGGFVPRVVAGSRTLSNHALGLAIDIDYISNPHIKNARVIELFNRIAADTGFKFSEHALAGEDLRGISRVDQIAEIHRRSSAASRKIQAWLAQHLPRYEALKQTIEEAQASQKAQLELEKKVARDRKGKIDTSGMTSTGAHVERERAARAELAADPDMQDLQIVEDFHFAAVTDLKVRYREFLRQMKAWQRDGIQSYPIELAAGLGHPTLGLRWGEEYSGHKDAMHFELEGGVPPEVKGGRDPELADLLGPSVKPWYLVAQRKARR